MYGEQTFSENTANGTKKVPRENTTVTYSNYYCVFESYILYSIYNSLLMTATA